MATEGAPELFEARAAAFAGEHPVSVDARDIGAFGELADARKPDLPPARLFAFCGSLPHHA